MTKETLFETAVRLCSKDEEEFMAWAASLEPADLKELWIQGVSSMMGLLTNLEEESDGKVSSDAGGRLEAQDPQLEACCDAIWRHAFRRPKSRARRKER